MSARTILSAAFPPGRGERPSSPTHHAGPLATHTLEVAGSIPARATRFPRRALGVSARPFNSQREGVPLARITTRIIRRVPRDRKPRKPLEFLCLSSGSRTNPGGAKGGILAFETHA